MARPLRIYVPGAWYHVTARGNERRDIVRSDSDREGFLTRLAAMTERFRLNLYAYVLMQNHFHLLVEPSEDNLSRAMQWLNVSYSQWFNRRGWENGGGRMGSGGRMGWENGWENGSHLSFFVF